MLLLSAAASASAAAAPTPHSAELSAPHRSPLTFELRFIPKLEYYEIEIVQILEAVTPPWVE